MVGVTGPIYAIRKGDIFKDMGDVEALCHCVRVFEDDSVYHIWSRPDPERDIEFVRSELLLHDLMFVEKRLERIDADLKRSKHEHHAEERALLERFPGDEERVRRMSLIDEAGGRSVRMAHLASVGSHTINGVAALHSDLLKRHVLRDFDELWPSKIRNVTNGVTPRRFVALINPGLARLVTEAIGDG